MSVYLILIVTNGDFIDLFSTNRLNPIVRAIICSSDSEQISIGLEWKNHVRVRACWGDTMPKTTFFLPRLIYIHNLFVDELT